MGHAKRRSMVSIVFVLLAIRHNVRPACSFVARWFITSLAGAGADDVPPGNFGPLETVARDEAKGGNFQGGPGMVQIVRYTEGPAGTFVNFCAVCGVDQEYNQSRLAYHRSL